MNSVVRARVGNLDSTPRDCDRCGHPFQEHLLCSHGKPAVSGWVECPIEGCTCESTWSLPPEQAEEVKRLSRESRDEA
jgi:hypothetical protein